MQKKYHKPFIPATWSGQTFIKTVVIPEKDVVIDKLRKISLSFLS